MDKTLLILACFCLVYWATGHDMSVDGSCLITLYQEREVEKMNSVEESFNQVTASFDKLSTEVQHDLLTTKQYSAEIVENSAELNTSIHGNLETVRNDTEHYLQRRNKEFENLKERFENQLTIMEAEYGEMRLELKNISAYLTRKTSPRYVYADILRMEALLEMFIQKELVKAREKIYSKIFPEFQKFVKDQEAIVKEPAYAFSATAVKPDSLESREPIIFTDVIVNDAGIYDVINGKFTSPTNGTFKVSFTLCVSYGKSMSFQIMAGGNVVSRVVGAAHSDAKTIVTGKAVVTLKRGDQVWVEARYKGYNILCTGGFSGLNKFSGYLLH